MASDQQPLEYDLLGSQPTQRPGLQPGMQLGGMALLVCLGRSGQGEVWTAHNPIADRTVALKQLLTEVQHNADKAAIQHVQAFHHQLTSSPFPDPAGQSEGTT